MPPRQKTCSLGFDFDGTKLLLCCKSTYPPDQDMMKRKEASKNSISTCKTAFPALVLELLF